MHISLRIILVFFTFFALFSCKKDKILKDSSAKLEFSADTVLFDTVFTSIGSVTKSVIIYNPHERPIRISNIRLAGGPTSQYRINVDGDPVFTAVNVDILGKDSLFIFVEVTVDPVNANSPLIVTDSIIFETNGNIQDIDLVAWGQDAHYFFPDRSINGLPPFSIISYENQHITWENDKPYVVYGYAVVDSASSLTIKPGVRVHFHKNSGLWVYRGGTIKANGTKEMPVTFQGDRLEYRFKDEPGQWDRIWINEGSINNVLDHVIIKNAFVGLQLETINFSPPLLPTLLRLTNSEIKNMSGIGIFSRYYFLAAHNNVISNCGQHTLAITYGGMYDFRQCTFANYWSGASRKTSSVLVSSESNFPLDLAYFGNCVITGDQEVELKVDDKTSATFEYDFEYTLVKSTEALDDTAHYRNIFKNNDPGFKDKSLNDYRPGTGSFMIDKGNESIILNPGLLYNGPISTDIEGNNRKLGPAPDLGAYEIQ